MFRNHFMGSNQTNTLQLVSSVASPHSFHNITPYNDEEKIFRIKIHIFFEKMFVLILTSLFDATFRGEGGGGCKNRSCHDVGHKILYQNPS